MDIRQLRYFVAIYEAGSVSKASLRLLVAQSALSQQLAQLEDELGVPLLTRSPQGVAPTAFGQLFYDRSRHILRQLGDAVEEVRQLGRALGGSPEATVEIGMAESISVVLGVPLLQNLTHRYPEVHLRLTEDPGANLKQRLHEGLLDLAILFDDGVDGALTVEPLVNEQLFLVSSRSAAYPAKIPMSQAFEAPLVLPDLRDGLRNTIENAANANGKRLLNLVSEINSLIVIKDAVAQGLAATILPLSCVTNELQQGTLHAHEIINTPIFCTVAICTRKDALHDRATSCVFRLAISTAKELCASRSWVGGEVIPDSK